MALCNTISTTCTQQVKWIMLPLWILIHGACFCYEWNSRSSELNLEILFLLNNQSNVLNCITILQNVLTIHVKGKNMRLNNNFQLKRQVILVNLFLDENWISIWHWAKKQFFKLYFFVNRTHIKVLICLATPPPPHCPPSKVPSSPSQKYPLPNVQQRNFWLTYEKS